MFGGYDDDETPDMFDMDEERDEAEISADEPAPEPAPKPAETQAPRSGVRVKRGRQLRIKPMTPKMRARHPHVVSLMLTHDDGRQLMFVRS